MGVNPLEFCRNLWHPKTRVPRLAYSVVCVILRLAVLVQWRLVTDEQTDGRTDRQTHDDSIYRVSIALRCNNSVNFGPITPCV